LEKINIDSWEVFNEHIFKDAWDHKINRYRSWYLFRGLPDSSYQMETSLKRLGHTDEQTREIERKILATFKKYAHRDAAEGTSDWNWLALAQHHGLPTRLLDWTYSPFVALHFAVGEIPNPEKDGVVWMVNSKEVHSHLPQEIEAAREMAGHLIANVRVLSEIAENIEDFDRLQTHDKGSFALFFEPPSLTERIVNQSALFSVLSDAAEQFDDWLKSRKVPYIQLIIRGDKKWEFRDKLDILNIHERVLFPGLDGLSRWLKRYYSRVEMLKPTTEGQSLATPSDDTSTHQLPEEKES
jgi:hypothetical protein